MAGLVGRDEGSWLQKIEVRSFRIRLNRVCQQVTASSMLLPSYFRHHKSLWELLWTCTTTKIAKYGYSGLKPP